MEDNAPGAARTSAILRLMGLGKWIWPVVALLCLVGAGPARAAAPPSMTWSPPEAIDAGTTVAGTSITGLSCPTTSLCVGVDAGGNAFWSTDPAAMAPSWTRAHIATAELTAVTCPTTVLCVAVGADGSIHTSTTPTAGAVAWSAVAGEPGTSFYDVACAGTTSCVAVGSVMTTGERARVATSANPTGGPGSWTAQTIGPATDNALNGVSCPTTTLCVASSDAGYLATATNPAGTWIARCG